MSVPLWIFLPVLMVTIVLAIFLFYRNPLPFPDRGHRLFCVKNERVAIAISGILRKSGLRERFTFSPGKTNQTIFWDNTTGLIWHEGDDLAERGLEPNAITLASSNPYKSAKVAADRLILMGFNAKIHGRVMSDDPDKFVMLTSNAFVGWNLAFRLPAYRMGDRPNLRKLGL